MKQHYNIILANAPILNGNRGCVALSITALYIIDRILKEANVDYDIYLPDSGHKKIEKHTYIAEDFKIEYHSCDYYKYTSLNTTVRKMVRSIVEKQGFKTIFKNADFILDLGQGDSFADIYGEGRFREINLIHEIAKDLNKPYCILPQTIGPFADIKIREIAHDSIACADLCMARDKQSYDYVFLNVHSQKTINEYIDVAFCLPYTKIEHDNNVINVGLNVSALLWNGGYTRNNQFGLYDDYQLIIRDVIDFFLSLPNVSIHLVSHAVGAEKSVDNDYEIAYKLWREYCNPRLRLAPFPLGPIEIKGYIAGLDFFMGARMHATIAAFSSGVAVIPMAYSRKFNGLFEDTLDYHYITDLKVQKNEEVLATIIEAYNKRDELKEIINNRMTTIVREREQLMYDQLRKFFKLNHYE